MNVTRMARVAGATLGALVIGSSADTIISVQFSGDTRAEMTATDLAGAPGVRVGNWNSILNTSDGILGDNETVIYEDGTTVGGGITFTPSSLGLANRGNSPLGDDASLFNGVKDNFGSTYSIAVANVPFAQYDLYVYRRGQEAVDRAGAYTVDGGTTTHYMRGGLADPISDGLGYVLSTDMDLGSGLSADVDQGNYIRISGLTGSSFLLEMDALDTDPTNGDVPRNKFAGLQIVMIPEPGTLALFGFAGGALLVFRRRT